VNKREWQTLLIMTKMYCLSHHSDKDICIKCEDFLKYAKKRLENCKFGEMKPTCNKCPVHCYKKEMRELAKTIMRFSGPKMIRKHPYLALIHLWNELNSSNRLNKMNYAKE